MVSGVNMSYCDPKMHTLLKKQKYQLFGKNTAVKKCNWTHNALREKRFCYKQFYGIKSHRCIQFSPTLICNFACLFCWRIHESDLGLKNMFHDYKPNNSERLLEMFDRPLEVVQGILKGQQKIICGYKPFVDPKMYEEAMNPKHATISLTGEPFLYPWIPELIEELKSRNMTVFIVTNGSVPRTLRLLLQKKSYPTQLYITLPAPRIKDFLRTHRPIEKELALDRVWESLRIIGKGVPFRTVGRLTVADGYNLNNSSGYAEMIKTMRPDFIEVKGVVHVGAAEKRIPRTAMPSHIKIKKFAHELKDKLPDYEIVRESSVSRLIILSNGVRPIIIPELDEKKDDKIEKKI